MYGLMDCNNFFVSCERLFRPDLLGKPVAVLSSNDGCIVSRSQEVKDLGIPMGVPYFKVRDLCVAKGVTLFSSNFTLYRDLSARVMHALREAAEGVEVYSIDEAFFSLPAGATQADAARVRAHVMRMTGIPVSVGVAPTKTLAKLESSFAKKGAGVHIFDPAAWPEVAAATWCSSIWGVGRQTEEALRRNGIETVAQFLAADRARVRKLLGIGGARLQLELAGIPAHGARERDAKLSIMSSRSFRRETSARAVVESAVGYHIAQIAEELRESGMRASRLYVSLRANRFGEWADRSAGKELVLAIPSNGTAELLHAALRLIADMYQPGVPYKKAGVSVGGLIPVSATTAPLFAKEAKDTRASELDPVIDALNARFGQGTVRPAIVMHTERWAASAELRSAAYTTRWREIPSVRAG